MITFPVLADTSQVQARTRGVSAIVTARRVLPAPVAEVIVEEIVWGMDKCSVLVDKGRHTALVDAVLGMDRL